MNPPKKDKTMKQPPRSRLVFVSLLRLTVAVVVLLVLFQALIQSATSIGETGGRAGFVIWYVFRWLLIVLAALFLVSGIDDLFFDLVHYGRLAYRRLFMRDRIRPVRVEQLEAVPEQAAAIMIPAWDESKVIARMLLNTVGTLRYKHYTIFVGTYPNDEATRREVEKAREIYPNIEFTVTPIEGPTNKADCLNWIYQAILLHEKRHGRRFDFFVMHDAEDLVHPLSLKYYNYLIPRMDFIQLPVFPLEGRWHDFVTGVYMDEFAENHTKDLRAREFLATYIPSAGVGTALSRRALDYLAARHQNQIFNITTLTEDYEMGLDLREFDGKKIFLQQRVERVETRRNPVTGKVKDVRVLEPVATREYFPRRFGAAVWQKSRWILGIGLQGWGLGWTHRVKSDYCLYRDRKAVLANLLTVLGYVVALYWLMCLALRVVSPGLAIPPLITAEESFAGVLTVILGLLAWRLVNRVAATWRIYGVLHALLAPPRLVFANVLNFCATVVAIRRYVTAKLRKQGPAWGKTAHAWPSEDQLLNFRLKLGDLLLERRLVTAGQLEAALAEQGRTGEKLGAILVRQGVLWEEDLVSALAGQNHEEAVEIDPFATPSEALRLMPRDVAERYQVFPLALEGDVLVLAADNGAGAPPRQDLPRILGREVRFKRCGSIDLQYALHCGYQNHREGSPLSDRLGARLLKAGAITAAQLKEALRRQKRSGRKLGDLLVELKAVTVADIEQELARERGDA
jgi:adsorption protein B